MATLPRCTLAVNIRISGSISNGAGLTVDLFCFYFGSWNSPYQTEYTVDGNMYAFMPRSSILLQLLSIALYEFSPLSKVSISVISSTRITFDLAITTIPPYL